MTHPFDKIKWPADTGLPTTVQGNDWKSDEYLNGGFKVAIGEDGSLKLSLNLAADCDVPAECVAGGLTKGSSDALAVMVIERALIDLRELLPAMSAIIQRGYNPPKGK